MSIENNPDYTKANTIHEFMVRNIKGELVKLDVYKGHVCIIVNVASKCNFTESNYQHFNELYAKYGQRGLRILAFPCNQFGESEPGSSEEIESFANEHNVKFDMFQKVEVNGENAHPLWKFLKLKQVAEEGKSRTKGNFIKWNFVKFIVNKRGVPVQRFSFDVDPLKLAKPIEDYLI